MSGMQGMLPVVVCRDLSNVEGACARYPLSHSRQGASPQPPQAAASQFFPTCYTNHSQTRDAARYISPGHRREALTAADPAAAAAGNRMVRQATHTPASEGWRGPAHTFAPALLAPLPVTRHAGTGEHSAERPTLTPPLMQCKSNKADVALSL